MGYRYATRYRNHTKAFAESKKQSVRRPPVNFAKCGIPVGTAASYELTVVPVIRKLTASPASVTLYTDSEDEAAVTVAAEPDIVPEGGMVPGCRGGHCGDQRLRKAEDQ